MSKVTMATIKSFVRKNQGKLYIRTKTRFDGMVDGCEPCKDQDFSPALQSDLTNASSHTLGIAGAWFVGQSRDYLNPINDGGFVGYHVYNCCGSFDLAVKA
jgi:hypothetical protein